VKIYRLYRFDGSRITAADLIEAVNDAEALVTAKRAGGGGVTREVWDRDRLVGRVGPDLATPSQFS
jgi:hypothetical protein